MCIFAGSSMTDSRHAAVRIHCERKFLSKVWGALKHVFGGILPQPRHFKEHFSNFSHNKSLELLRMNNTDAATISLLTLSFHQAEVWPNDDYSKPSLHPASSTVRRMITFSIMDFYIVAGFNDTLYRHSKNELSLAMKSSHLYRYLFMCTLDIKRHLFMRRLNSAGFKFVQLLV